MSGGYSGPAGYGAGQDRDAGPGHDLGETASYSTDGSPGPAAGGALGDMGGTAATGVTGPGSIPPPGPAGGREGLTQPERAREPGQGPGEPVPPRRGGAAARRTRRKSRSWWIELPVLLFFALVLALLIKTFVVQAFFIPSSSMENTLEIGDKVLVNKLVYDFRPIHRGDIVVFNGDGSWDAVPVVQKPALTRLWESITGLFGTAPGVHDYIKRVIGVPGDRVACCDKQGHVTVNGVPLSEKTYLYPGNVPSATAFHIVVPPGRLWVMGDHRSVSWDSRGHMNDPGRGSIPEDKVVGRAFVIIAPISRWRILPIPGTFQQPQLSAAASAAGLLASGPGGTLALGFAGALPLTWVQRRLRRRLGGLLRGRPRPARARRGHG